jgi:hypothetical protein
VSLDIEATAETCLAELAGLLCSRNEIDRHIAGVIGRTATTGHIGEFVAAAIFDIELAASGVQAGFECQPTINSVDLNIHCNDYTRYFQTFTNSGFPKSIFNATNCFDTDGVRYYVHVEAVDRGEPGVESGDSLCITVKTFPAKNSLWTFKDRGTITDGNVQIHPDTQDTIVDDGTAA